MAAVVVRPTRFRQLVEQNKWAMVETFNMHFQKAARELAEQASDEKLTKRLLSLSVPKRKFERWMSGDLDTVPHRDTRQVLEYLFDIPAEELFRTISANDAPVGTRDVYGLSTQGHEVRAAPPFNMVHGREGDAPGQSGASGLAAFPPQPLAVDAARNVAQLGFDVPATVADQTRLLLRTTADSTQLTVISIALESIVDRYEELGPLELTRETRMWREMLRMLILSGYQPPRTQVELFRLTARASGLLGYMAVNAGAPFAVADAYCADAEELAREAGDTALEVWAAGTRSLGLYYAGRYRESDLAAQAGIALAPGSPQAIRLLVNGRARALARMGDRAGTERAVGEALELSDRQPGLPEGLTSCISFAPYSIARTCANAATASLHAGDALMALSYAEQIDELVERSTSDWSRALVRIDVAMALLQKESPEVEQAMELGRSALRAGTAAPIQSVWKRANELYDEAGRWHDVASVREYAEELRAWRSHPQAQLIVAGSSAGAVP